MPDLVRHPVPFWIPAFAGMTTVGYLAAGVISLMLNMEMPLLAVSAASAHTVQCSVGR